MPYDYDDNYTPPSPPPPTVYSPVISTTSLASGAVGAAYAQQLYAVLGTPAYSYKLAAGGLPPGLTLATTGAISGTPTASGTYIFVATVTDSAGRSGSSQLQIAIPSAPTIQTFSLPTGTVGVPYLGGLTGTGGAAPYGFQVSAGSLPSGLTLATTGGITGTPTVAGTFSVTIEIYDSGSPQGIGTATFALTVSRATTGDVSSLAQCVLVAGQDGALYIVVEGQKHDEDYNGDPVAIHQRWQGVPNSSPQQSLQKLGGATVAAKGSGDLQVQAIDSIRNVTALSTERRPMALQPGVETVRDFMATAVPESERFGIALDNGDVVDAWFEAHTAKLYTRPTSAARKG